MAISNKLGTFMGQPVDYWDGTGKPKCGDLVVDHASYCMHVYDGAKWHEISTLDMDAEHMSELQRQIFHKQNLTSEYLEEQYPELKAKREEYEELLEKFKVFEILKRDNT
jgi:hypothetical protein